MKIDKSKIPATSRVVPGRVLQKLRIHLSSKGKPVEWVDAVKQGITETELADLLRAQTGATVKKEDKRVTK